MTTGGRTKDVVYAPIYSCQDCKHCDVSRYYTADSYEMVDAWNCNSPKLRSKYKGKNGTTDREEWREPPGIGLAEGIRRPPPIPKWCPFRKTRKK